MKRTVLHLITKEVRIMKNELKILMRLLRDESFPLIEEAKTLSTLTLVERKEKGEALEKRMEEVLRVRGPLYDLEEALDDVRFIVRVASEGVKKLAYIA